MAAEVETEEVKAHETSTYMVRAAPPELDARTGMLLRVRLSCPEKCDLQGAKVRLMDDEGAAVEEIELVTFCATANETDEFLVKGPIEPGAYTWTAVFPAQEKEGRLHKESSTSFSFIVKPHATSIAVWDVLSPVGFGDEFSIKVGARCSAECNLTGQKIEIYDHGGAKLGTATLGGVPWSATSALYWAEVQLEAPDVQGYYRWRVELRELDLELPHEGASYDFTFATARPAEHVVTVEVLDRAKKTPIKGALVALHSGGAPYRNRTDHAGVARLSVPKGRYKLHVSMADYEDLNTTAEVAGDAELNAELIFWPEDQR